jgi:hypothetical protein
MRPTSTRQFLSASQQTAWDSGNRDAIQAADDAALAQAIMASLAELEELQTQDDSTSEDDLIQAAITESLKPSGKGRSRIDQPKNAEAYLDLQAQKTSGLRTWFQNNGFDVIHNSGGGSNNCLLISLLQHATGDYRSEHTAEVRHYRQQLMKWDKTIKKNDPLPSSGKLIEDLIELVLKEKKCNSRFAIAGPGLGTQPSWHFYGSGKDYAIIFDQSGHYEAVIPRRAKSA